MVTREAREQYVDGFRFVNGFAWAGGWSERGNARCVAGDETRRLHEGRAGRTLDEFNFISVRRVDKDETAAG